MYRSLFIERLRDGSLFNILKWLAEEGYLQNNRRLKVQSDYSCIFRFPEMTCSMKNLESLDLDEDLLTPDALAHVFQSCSKITHLHIKADGWCGEMFNMDEHLKNQLRTGFQKLRCLYLVCYIDDDTWPMFQEMLT
jgi:hypothetical protein